MAPTDQTKGNQREMPSYSLTCGIERLSEWYPRLYLEPDVVACVAVLSRHSSTPVVIDVDCENIPSPTYPRPDQIRLELSWSDETARRAEQFQATYQSNVGTERAACALALLLVHHLLGESEVDVTEYGERADYRLLNSNRVLEISGTTVAGELPRRHRDKTLQALDNPMGWDALVCVCAFSETGHRVRFSFHQT